jgi:hypothetical protein
LVSVADAVPVIEVLPVRVDAVVEMELFEVLVFVSPVDESSPLHAGRARVRTMNVLATRVMCFSMVMASAILSDPG